MDKQYDIPYSEHISNITFLPDFELKYSEKDLDNLSKDLSEEDEKILKEILELETLNSGKTDFMKELLEAAKRGAMQYIDSMTDTGETFNRAKDPSSVSSLDNENIIKQHHSADPNEKREKKERYYLLDIKKHIASAQKV